MSSPARTIVCFTVAGLLTALGLVPLDLRLWAPALLIAATFVQVWAGGPLYRGAWPAMRRGRATMDTMLVAGAGSAYAYSTFVILWPGPAAAWGFRAPISLGPSVLLLAVAQLGRWLEAGAGHSRLADRVSVYLAPALLVLALLTLGGWLALGHLQVTRGLEAALAVLLAGAPAALCLVAPLAALAGRRRAAARGVFLGERQALERLRRVKTVVFDRTGTLTRGHPEVTGIRALDVWDERSIIRLAAATETASTDALGAAVVRRTQGWKMTMPPAGDFICAPGRGVRARVEGHDVVLGSLTYLDELEIPAGELRELSEEVAADGSTPVAVAVDGRPAGLLEVSDPPRPEAAEVVSGLKDLGLEVWLMTGDLPAAARGLAAQTGVERVAGAVPSEERAAQVRSLKSSGTAVAMVGDGLDDAAALDEADVGIVVAGGEGGLPPRVAASDMTLARDDLRGILDTLALARRSAVTARQGVVLALVYNVLLLPLATGAILPGLGLWLMPPLVVAAVLLSCVSVALNTLRR